MGSQKRPAHETAFINSHFPADTVDKTDGVTLEGAARDHDDADTGARDAGLGGRCGNRAHREA